jgi:acyl carrier protein
LSPDRNYDETNEGAVMDRAEALEKFNQHAVDVLAVEVSQLTLDATFGDDLGADSLDLVELVMALEEEFDVEVGEDELKDIRTVGQAFELIFAKL